MARNKKRTRPMIRIPKDPLGPDRMYISITDEELPQVKRLLGFAGTKGKGGVISFFNPGGGTGGPGDEGALGQMAGSSATGTSPTGSRGPGTQTASSRSNPSGSASSPSRSSTSSSSTGTGARGPGTQNASSRSNPSGPAGSPSRGGPSGSGGQNTGGQNTGGRGNEAGGVGAQSGGSGASRSGSVAAGTRGGVTNPGGTQGGAQPAGRTPGGGAQPGSGALGQMARSMAPGTRTPGGGASPASGMLGQMAGPPRTPGAAMGLLGATRSPQKMQDRIGPEITDRGPLGPQGQPTGFDPTRPVGRPTPDYDPLSSILSPNAKAKNRMSQLLGENEVPLARNPYDTTFNYGKPAYGTNFTDIDLTKSTLDQVLDWQSENTYDNPKFGTVQTPAVGITQAKQRTLEEAAKNLGLTGDTVMTPDVWDDINVEIAKMQGIGAWEGLKGKSPEKVQAREDFEKAFEEASQLVGKPFTGATPDYNDPIWSGQSLEPTDTRPGPGDFSPISAIPSDTRITPAGGLLAKDQSRISQDPSFNPANNPDYSPSRMPSPFEGPAPERTPMMGTEPGMFGPIAPKQIQDRVPGLGNPAEDQRQVQLALRSLGVTNRPTPEIEQAPEALPEDIYNQINNPPRAYPGRPVGAVPVTRSAMLGSTQPPFESPDWPGPILPSALPNVPTPREKPPSLANTPFPGRSLVNPMLGQDTEPETVPTDITQQGSWPKDLVPSSGMPQGTLRDRLIQDAVAEDEGREPANISPEIPVNVRVKNSVVKKYGPDMAEEILTTVTAIKQAMGYDTKHGQRGGGRRGRGIGQLAMMSKQKRIPLKGTGHATRVIPPEAPLLET